MSDQIFKPVAICHVCSKFKICGEDCASCTENINFSTNVAKYAVAMKAAMKCWQDVDCEEHDELCQPRLKEFAIKILELQSNIELLKSAIIKHRNNKDNPDKNDIELWNSLIMNV